MAWLRSTFGSKKVTITFDGYLSMSTKDHMHQKRQPVSSLPVTVDADLSLLSSKLVFLSNRTNKQAFIYLLGAALRDAGHSVNFCISDADVAIAMSSIEKVTYLHEIF